MEVPEAVSRAFAAYARAGRIAFEGLLNETPIRGRLVPVGRGRHRLFVNGGMRAAAGVATGDTASFTIRPTPMERVRPPADLAAALRRETGARTAFDALSPSYRHELLRYIDDARTPQTRRRRVRETLDHVRGRNAPVAPGVSATRPLWTCPRCGNEFVTRNAYHSCHRRNLEEPFAGKPEGIRALFDRLRAVIEGFGPVKLVPYRDKVGFMVRVRFAAAVPRMRWLDVAFWLRRRIESARFQRIETIHPGAHVHLVRVTEARDLDAELTEWLHEAYAVGRQEPQIVRDEEAPPDRSGGAPRNLHSPRRRR